MVNVAMVEEKLAELLEDVEREGAKPWEYDPEKDRLPPEFSRKKPLDKYPELDMDNFDEEEIESVMHEVTRDDPYMPRM